MKTYYNLQIGPLTMNKQWARLPKIKSNFQIVTHIDS